MDPHRHDERRGPGAGTTVVVAALVSALVSCSILVVGFVAGAAYVGSLEGRVGALEAGSAWSDAPPPAPAPAAAGTPIEGLLVPGGERAQIWRIEVPPDAILVRADLSCEDADLDLSLTFGGASPSDGDWSVVTSALDGEAFASLARDDDPSFGRAPVLVRVDTYEPVESDIAYVLDVTVVRHRVAGRLALGERTTTSLDPDTGHRANFQVVLPDGVDVVRLDLVDAGQDLDLFADVSPVLDTAHAAVASTTPRTRESVLLDRRELRLPGGEQVLHVTVADRALLDRIVPFTLVATEGPDAPAGIDELPALATARTPVERAALSVVEVTSASGRGSGVVVGDGRHVLTASHVVGETGSEDVVIAVITDWEREPVEALRGRVLRTDPELDVALIEIVSTLASAPVPAEWRIPAAVLAERAPALGDAVLACGFPQLHEAGDRAEVTWTRGVLAGFERPHDDRLLRFDAEIAGGSSGGALLDASYALIGITVATHADTGQFSATGLAVPVSEIPDDWLALPR